MLPPIHKNTTSLMHISNQYFYSNKPVQKKGSGQLTTCNTTYACNKKILTDDLNVIRCHLFHPEIATKMAYVEISIIILFIWFPYKCTFRSLSSLFLVRVLQHIYPKTSINWWIKDKETINLCFITVCLQNVSIFSSSGNA